jgi:hypothetical protein
MCAANTLESMSSLIFTNARMETRAGKKRRTEAEKARVEAAEVDVPDIVERLARTKTMEECRRLEARLIGELAIAPPGQYYGALFEGVLRVRSVMAYKQAHNL